MRGERASPPATLACCCCRAACEPRSTSVHQLACLSLRAPLSSLAQGKRGELFITSKVWNDQHRPEEVRCARRRRGPLLLLRVAVRLSCLCCPPRLPLPDHRLSTAIDPSIITQLCSKSAEQSIAELGCSYLDLLLIHWPVAWLPGTEEQDTEVTLQQTWRVSLLRPLCACAVFRRGGWRGCTEA